MPAWVVLKCLVLDLDNTLWGGTMSDLKWNRIGKHTSVGRSILLLQIHQKPKGQRQTKQQSTARMIHENCVKYLTTLKCL